MTLFSNYFWNIALKMNEEIHNVNRRDLLKKLWNSSFSGRIKKECYKLFESNLRFIADEILLNLQTNSYINFKKF